MRIMDEETRRSAEIAAAFATYMYVAVRIDAKDGKTAAQIVRDVDSGTDGVKKSNNYRAFRAAVMKYPHEAGEMTLDCQSRLLEGDLSAARAAVFHGGGRAYVAFRGTADLEWVDNGVGMFEQSTRLQRLAAAYFDYAADKFDWDDDDYIIVCGHSKGGNKAQFVTLDSVYGGIINECWSFDGQGFSPEAIKYYKKKLGERYAKRTAIMRSVCGGNDYVNPLGTKIISSKDTYFIETPNASLEKFLSNHVIENLWEKTDGKFTGSLNTECDSGDLCGFSKKLSGAIMNLPDRERRSVALTIMELIENLDGEKVPEEERRSTKEMVSALISAVPGMATNLFLTIEGRHLTWDYYTIFADSRKKKKISKFDALPEKKKQTVRKRQERHSKYPKRIVKAYYKAKDVGVHLLMGLLMAVLAPLIALVWLFGAIKRKYISARGKTVQHISPQLEPSDLSGIGTRTIETEHLILRRFEYSDTASMMKNWVSDPLVQLSYREPVCGTRREVRGLLDKYILGYESGDYFRWAMISKENGECIGQIAYYHVDAKNDFAEMEYCVGRGYQGRGYATEAARAVISYGFDKIGLHRVQICHRESNTASKRVIEKCGFIYEGMLREYFRFDDSYEGRLYYSILRSEYEKELEQK